MPRHVVQGAAAPAAPVPPLSAALRPPKSREKPTFTIASDSQSRAIA